RRGQRHAVTGFEVVAVLYRPPQVPPDQADGFRGHRVGHRVLPLVDTLFPTRQWELAVVHPTVTLDRERECVDAGVARSLRRGPITTSGANPFAAAMHSRTSSTPGSGVVRSNTCTRTPVPIASVVCASSPAFTRMVSVTTNARFAPICSQAARRWCRTASRP